mmetsp:Transcript_34645/g.87683  ORF Transcript_34645/g.87683 Transcript_34645/m.87683 type:complete len:212 (+) Transcript_34645:462-1097(+)
MWHQRTTGTLKLPWQHLSLARASLLARWLGRFRCCFRCCLACGSHRLHLLERLGRALALQHHVRLRCLLRRRAQPLQLRVARHLAGRVLEPRNLLARQPQPLLLLVLAGLLAVEVVVEPPEALLGREDAAELVLLRERGLDGRGQPVLVPPARVQVLQPLQRVLAAVVGAPRPLDRLLRVEQRALLDQRQRAAQASPQRLLPNDVVGLGAG